jgi:serine/threonine protein kinase
VPIEALFRIGREIGHGSFGTVYAAERISDGEAVVVKKIHIDVLSDEDRAGALREAATLSQFNHANIIRYYESRYHDGACSCLWYMQTGSQPCSSLDSALVLRVAVHAYALRAPLKKSIGLPLPRHMI